MTTPTTIYYFSHNLDAMFATHMLMKIHNGATKVGLKLTDNIGLSKVEPPKVEPPKGPKHRRTNIAKSGDENGPVMGLAFTVSSGRSQLPNNSKDKKAHNSTTKTDSANNDNIRSDKDGSKPKSSNTKKSLKEIDQFYDERIEAEKLAAKEREAERLKEEELAQVLHNAEQFEIERNKRGVAFFVGYVPSIQDAHNFKLIIIFNNYVKNVHDLDDIASDERVFIASKNLRTNMTLTEMVYLYLSDPSNNSQGPISVQHYQQYVTSMSNYYHTEGLRISERNKAIGVRSSVWSSVDNEVFRQIGLLVEMDKTKNPFFGKQRHVQQSLCNMVIDLLKVETDKGLLFKELYDQNILEIDEDAIRAENIDIDNHISNLNRLFLYNITVDNMLSAMKMEINVSDFYDAIVTIIKNTVKPVKVVGTKDDKPKNIVEETDDNDNNRKKVLTKPTYTIDKVIIERYASLVEKSFDKIVKSLESRLNIVAIVMGAIELVGAFELASLETEVSLYIEAGNFKFVKFLNTSTASNNVLYVRGFLITYDMGKLENIDLMTLYILNKTKKDYSDGFVMYTNTMLSGTQANITLIRELTLKERNLVEKDPSSMKKLFPKSGPKSKYNTAIATSDPSLRSGNKPTIVICQGLHASGYFPAAIGREDSVSFRDDNLDAMLSINGMIDEKFKRLFYGPEQTLFLENAKNGSAGLSTKRERTPRDLAELIERYHNRPDDIRPLLVELLDEINILQITKNAVMEHLLNTPYEKIDIAKLISNESNPLAEQLETEALRLRKKASDQSETNVEKAKKRLTNEINNYNKRVQEINKDYTTTVGKIRRAGKNLANNLRQAYTIYISKLATLKASYSDIMNSINNRYKLEISEEERRFQADLKFVSLPYEEQLKLLREQYSKLNAQREALLKRILQLEKQISSLESSNSRKLDEIKRSRNDILLIDKNLKRLDSLLDDGTVTGRLSSKHIVQRNHDDTIIQLTQLYNYDVLTFDPFTAAKNEFGEITWQPSTDYVEEEIVTVSEDDIDDI